MIAKKRGLKRPALLHCGYPFTKMVLSVFERNCTLAPEIYCHFLQPKMMIEDLPFQWTEKLHQILHDFAAMPENVRPDVLFIPDDIITSIAHREILKMQKNGIDWDPHFIFSTSKQIPILPYGSVKGDYFEYDVMAKADAAVKLLIDIICGKKQQPETIGIKPKYFSTLN